MNQLNRIIEVHRITKTSSSCLSKFIYPNSTDDSSFSPKSCSVCSHVGYDLPACFPSPVFLGGSLSCLQAPISASDALLFLNHKGQQKVNSEKRYVHAQGGVTLKSLHAALATHGLTMTNFGSISEQTRWHADHSHAQNWRRPQSPLNACKPCTCYRLMTTRSSALEAAIRIFSLLCYAVLGAPASFLMFTWRLPTLRVCTTLRAFRVTTCGVVFTPPSLQE